MPLVKIDVFGLGGTLDEATLDGVLGRGHAFEPGYVGQVKTTKLG